MASCSAILDKIYPLLSQSLNVPNLVPYLKQVQLLTDDEEERLEIGPNNTRQDAVAKLVRFLKTKGTDLAPVRVLLCALKKSMLSDGHLGHNEIIEELESLLEVADSTQVDSSVPLFVNVVDTTPECSSLTPYAHTPPSHIVTKGIENLTLQNAKPPSIWSRAHMEYAQFEYVQSPRKDRKEVEQLRCKIVDASQQIVTRFATLVLDVYRLLQDKHVSVDQVRLTILFLGCSDSKLGHQGIPNMFESSSEITQAQDLVQLIGCLHKYSSWFNYLLIQYVATTFGGPEGEILISNYELALKAYFTDLIAYQCPEFSLTKEVPEGFQELVVKIAEEYTSYRIQDTTLLRNTMARLFHLEPYVFQLKSVEEGCVLLKWVVPSYVASLFISQAGSYGEELKKYHVMSISTGGEVVHISSAEDYQFSKVCLAMQGIPPQRSHPDLRPVDSGTSADTVSISSLSELTISTSKRSSHISNTASSHRSSRDSTFLGLKRLSNNAAELEILSIYSGASADVLASPQLRNRVSPCNSNDAQCEEQSLPNILTLKPSPSHQYPRFYSSEADLLSTPASPLLLPESQSLSQGQGLNCYGTVGDPRLVSSVSPSKNRARCHFRSPVKLLRMLRFSRRKRTRGVLSSSPKHPQSSNSQGNNRMSILKLSVEPSLRGKLHYYYRENENVPSTHQSSPTKVETQTPAYFRNHLERDVNSEKPVVSHECDANTQQPTIACTAAQQPNAVLQGNDLVPESSLIPISVLVPSSQSSSNSPAPFSPHGLRPPRFNFQVSEESEPEVINTPFLRGSDAPFPHDVLLSQDYIFPSGSPRLRTYSVPHKHTMVLVSKRKASCGDTLQQVRAPYLNLEGNMKDLPTRGSSPGSQNSLACPSSGRTSAYFSQSSISTLSTINVSRLSIDSEDGGLGQEMLTASPNSSLARTRSMRVNLRHTIVHQQSSNQARSHSFR